MSLNAIYRKDALDLLEDLRMVIDDRNLSLRQARDEIFKAFPEEGVVLPADYFLVWKGQKSNEIVSKILKSLTRSDKVYLTYTNGSMFMLQLKGAHFDAGMTTEKVIRNFEKQHWFTKPEWSESKDEEECRAKDCLLALFLGKGIRKLKDSFCLYVFRDDDPSDFTEDDLHDERTSRRNDRIDANNWMESGPFFRVVEDFEFQRRLKQLLFFKFGEDLKKLVPEKRLEKFGGVASIVELRKLVYSNVGARKPRVNLNAKEKSLLADLRASKIKERKDDRREKWSKEKWLPKIESNAVPFPKMMQYEHLNKHVYDPLRWSTKPKRGDGYAAAGDEKLGRTRGATAAMRGEKRRTYGGRETTAQMVEDVGGKHKRTARALSAPPRSMTASALTKHPRPQPSRSASLSKIPPRGPSFSLHGLLLFSDRDDTAAAADRCCSGCRRVRWCLFPPSDTLPLWLPLMLPHDDPMGSNDGCVSWPPWTPPEYAAAADTAERGFAGTAAAHTAERGEERGSSRERRARRPSCTPKSPTASALTAPYVALLKARKDKNILFKVFVM
uniref:Uncharacterized protein n=1 Tax=Chromera velia CCMP2878 TaxID=1169474 RepID=A0A0G4FSC7_9ALVE|eukprot:Cvel_18428.t1-p1 / transcript=Cvel_18428.t1 / gene=Cvel_18428 / organism=Chromera_velia_CCMP2878 / gene_product=hypothetical protein / transcript_product=hypothetical protein / location=Cvel_scaffold1525:28040-39905(-) / protein_length=555 / sequence_SO=supercontig / SO=protein_coding / is_pseudo=false